MRCKIGFIQLFRDIVESPEFAVKEYNAFRFGLCAEAAACCKILIQPVAELQGFVIAAVPQDQMIEG